MNSDEVELGGLYWCDYTVDMKRRVVKVLGPFTAIEAQDLGSFYVRFLRRRWSRSQDAVVKSTYLFKIPWLVQLAITADERYDYGLDS